MSYTTDVVFVIPEGLDAEAAAERFEDLVERYHGWRPNSAGSCGPKATGSYVYFCGTNYLNMEMVVEIANGDWPPGTILYTHPEDEVGIGPYVTVFGEPRANPTRLLPPCMLKMGGEEW